MSNMITISRHDLEQIKKSLEFYRDGLNHEIIVNRRTTRVDFEVERDKLIARGFTFDGESYNGDEYFVENGQTAQKAVELIDNILDAWEI